jgi:cobalt/nickel transport system permease protein
MHIPDGYLSPQTYVPAYVAMTPIWSVAARNVKKTLRTRQIPLLALGAAFCFVIMMFNIPIPGGTTGHAVGSVLIAILLGPWAAVMAVSLALAAQALIFGDGGITAFGANCLNMAVLMPFAGYLVYRLVSGDSPLASPRRALAGAIGGYVGINAAALSCGIMLGIQPLIAHDASGRALFCPFGLSVALPAMMIGHLLAFGFADAAATGLVIRYLQRVDPALFADSRASQPAIPAKPIRSRLAWGLGALILLTPLGLYLPSRFNAGSAWGEWSANEAAKIVGYAPKGMLRLDGLWKAPLPDYSLPGLNPASGAAQNAAYLLSALIGVGLLVAAFWGMKRLIAKKETHGFAADLDDPAIPLG